MTMGLGASLLLGACSLPGAGSSEGDEQVLRIGMASDAQSLDPPNFVLAGDFARTGVMYETLLRLTNDGDFVPALATEWEQLSPTEWEFTLREGVTFHDGTELDSTAVKLSLERASTQSQGTGFLGMITEVRTPDPLTAVVVLEREFSSILNNLTVPVAAIISAQALEEKSDDELANEPVGTGQYQFVEWVPDTVITVEAFPDYWGDAATLDEVEFIPVPEASTRYSALQAGDVDVIENPPPDQNSAIEASDEFHAIVEPKARPIFLGFNLETVTDPVVRQAVAHAIDRQAIVDNVLEGVGNAAIEGLAPPQLLPYEESIGFSYDPDEARRLLEGAGTEDLTLTLTLPSARYLKDREIGEVVQQQLADVGITLELDVQEPGTWYQSLLDHETEMYYLGWGMSSGDPADMLLRLFRSDAVNNMSQLKDPEVDSMLDSMATLAVGSDERAQVMHDVQRVVLEDEVAVIPIYHMVNYYAARNGVENFHTTTSELIDLTQTTITQ